MKGSRILVLGVAYKKNVGDMRESPAIEIIQGLRAKGAAVSYNDPFVPYVQLDGWSAESVELTPETLAEADCVLLVTDHAAYDWDAILPQAQLFVDTRNVARGRERLARRIVKL